MDFLRWLRPITGEFAQRASVKLRRSEGGAVGDLRPACSPRRARPVGSACLPSRQRRPRRAPRPASSSRMHDTSKRGRGRSNHARRLASPARAGESPILPRGGRLRTARLNRRRRAAVSLRGRWRGSYSPATFIIRARPRCQAVNQRRRSAAVDHVRSPRVKRVHDTSSRDRRSRGPRAAWSGRGHRRTLAENVLSASSRVECAHSSARL